MIMHFHKRILSRRRLLNREEHYTKIQIALQYLPELDPDTAMRTLRRWIQQDTALNTALCREGYTPRQRHFTARQVSILREYLGDP